MKEKLKKFKSLDYFLFLRILVAILISIIIIAIIVFATSKDPLNALSCLFLGPISSVRSLLDILSYMIPLVFTGLAMNIVFKAGLFNMGADGAFFMGAAITALMAVSMNLPSGISQPLIIITAAFVGGLINTIPALIRRYTGASEVVVSLMFNYVFFFLGLFLINRTILDTTYGNVSLPFRKEALIPKIWPQYSLHWGIVVMLVVVVIMYFVIERSKFGYKLKITGLNRKFAKYSGISVGIVVILSQFIGGALAGMGGSIQILGMFTRFSWTVQVMYAWNGILVNILAAERPQMIPISAFFLSYLSIGADNMAMNSDVDSTIITVIQSIIILLVSAERFLYAMKKRKEEKEALRNNEIMEGVAD